ncbi:MAG: c-type cytochrome [Planctomycetes bacterium]|nr:c-type cytochrome [Planctomycetota bacterium]
MQRTVLGGRAWRRWPVLGACAGGLLLGVLAACRASAPTNSDPSAEGSARAAALYMRHCAACHGEEGRGDGTARPYLYPPARDFSVGRFRLASTVNGTPTDEDLMATLARGMPGSAMPAWSWMSESDLRLLARHVRELSGRALVERLRNLSALERQPFDEPMAEGLVALRLKPGRAALLPKDAHYDKASPERGGELYATLCASCHGATGRGSGAVPTWNEDGSLNWARDFTAGVLKGGGTRDALARRILVGMPGSAMPSLASLPPEDTASLVLFVQRLIPGGSDQRLVHRSGELRVARTPPPEPGQSLQADDPRWQAVPELDVVLSPLLWHEGAVRSASLSALHDGERMYVRVRWGDPTRDDEDLGGQEMPRGAPARDGMALAFSNEEAPPLFGMGSHETPVNLWHWKAARMIDAVGLLDLLGAQVHVLRDPVFRESRLDVAPLYVPAPGSAISGGRTQALSGESIGEPRDLEDVAQPIAADARWEEGRWTVVLSRALAGRAPEEAKFAPGTRLVAALAIWDGSGGDRGGSKSISIWQRLVLE